MAKLCYFFSFRLINCKACLIILWKGVKTRKVCLKTVGHNLWLRVTSSGTRHSNVYGIWKMFFLGDLGKNKLSCTIPDIHFAIFFSKLQNIFDVPMKSKLALAHLCLSCFKKRKQKWCGAGALGFYRFLLSIKDAMKPNVAFNN